MDRYVGDAIRVKGIKGFDISLGPRSTFNVIAIQQHIKRPPSHASPSFTRLLEWRTQKNQLYGLKFAYPKSFRATGTCGHMTPDFPAETGTVVLSCFKIPQDVSPGSNFTGGFFAISVNPKIKNQASCEQFAEWDPRFLSTVVVNGTRYAAMTDGYIEETDHSYHTFQNGLCYEFAFNFGWSRLWPDPLGCMVSVFSDSDVIKPLMKAVSFIPPAVSRTPTRSGIRPTVISFTASSTVADLSQNRHQLTFSWSTRNADYVELSQRCAKGAEGGTVGTDRQRDLDCSNLEPVYPANRSPNGFATVGFRNFDHARPLPVVVTITPFLRAIPYKDSSKSVTIMVNPEPTIR